MAEATHILINPALPDPKERGKNDSPPGFILHHFDENDDRTTYYPDDIVPLEHVSDRHLEKYLLRYEFTDEDGELAPAPDKWAAMLDEFEKAGIDGDDHAETVHKRRRAHNPRRATRKAAPKRGARRAKADKVEPKADRVESKARVRPKRTPKRKKKAATDGASGA